jgi:hypothetical protein
MANTPTHTHLPLLLGAVLVAHPLGVLAGDHPALQPSARLARHRCQRGSGCGLALRPPREARCPAGAVEAGCGWSVGASTLARAVAW